MIRPVFNPSNQLYNDLDPTKRGRLLYLIREIGELLNANRPGSDTYAGDDLICWFRNLGFLEDIEFQDATEPYKASLFIRSKLWRIYTYCWAVKQSPKHGTKIDLGCYDGKVVDIAQRYVPGMEWCVFDRFEGDKENHGAQLFDDVKARLDPFRTFVHKGNLPDALKSAWDWRFQNIGFIHVDLNDGQSEVECLELLWPKLVQGGIVLLDDYGWLRYRHSHELHKAFFRERGHEVLEVPSGQGLVVKR